MSNRQSPVVAAMLLLVTLGAGAFAVPQEASAAEPLTEQIWDDAEDEEFDLEGLGAGGKDEAGEAPTSTPSKEDRADVLADVMPFDDPALRAAVLKELYGQLRKAKDAAAAEPIIEAIEMTWHRSGSDTIDLLMSRVDTFVLQGDLDLATQVLDAVTDLAPDNAEAWYQRAIVYSMRNDIDQALSDLKQALAIDPDHYKAFRTLGAALEQTGDKKGALDAYRRALEINPFFEQARRAEKFLSPDVEGKDI
jgi:tetratricopeptide (TPR) repeat protein